MATVLQREGVVVENRRCTPTLAIMVLQVADIPAALAPGQFIHVKLPGMEEHPLRRPFSVMDVDVQASTLSVLYQAVGFATERMLGFEPGVKMDVMGPIGHGWQLADALGKTLVVCGGVGAAPLFMHAKELASAGKPFEVILGAQTKDALVMRRMYADILGHEPLCATDDGSYGTPGFLTPLVEQELDGGAYDRVVCCGPEPMMHIVADKALAAGVKTQVSLEKRMACGIGACLSCTVDTPAGKKRACVDGPVFDAAEVIW